MGKAKRQLRILSRPSPSPPASSSSSISISQLRQETSVHFHFCHASIDSLDYDILLPLRNLLDSHLHNSFVDRWKQEFFVPALVRRISLFFDSYDLDRTIYDTI
jgi:hypothetical protein